MKYWKEAFFISTCILYVVIVSYILETKRRNENDLINICKERGELFNKLYKEATRINAIAEKSILLCDSLKQELKKCNDQDRPKHTEIAR